MISPLVGHFPATGILTLNLAILYCMQILQLQYYRKLHWSVELRWVDICLSAIKLRGIIGYFNFSVHCFKFLCFNVNRWTLCHLWLQALNWSSPWRYLSLCTDFMIPCWLGLHEFLHFIFLSRNLGLYRVSLIFIQWYKISLSLSLAGTCSLFELVDLLCVIYFFPYSGLTGQNLFWPANWCNSPIVVGYLDEWMFFLETKI